MRSFLRYSVTVCTTLLLSCFLQAQDKPAATPEVKPLKALLVTGGCCHDYDIQKELISKGLWQRAHIDVTVVRQGGNATNSKIPLYESTEWSKGFDVVIHDECFADVKDTEWVDNILKPHRDGLPAVVLHCAMHCYRDGREDWFKFCGVTSRQHGAHYPHEVLNRDAEHPIMRGWGAGWFNPAGELYWIEKVWPTAHPLASAKNREKGNEEVCVWTNEFGEKKTRVFGTTLGHHNETVSDPKFLDLLTRGTLWACGKLDVAQAARLSSSSSEVAATDGSEGKKTEEAGGPPALRSYLKTPSAEAQWVPINLALKKPTRVSSTQAGQDAKNAVDGAQGSRWCADGGSVPQWLEVDLGKAMHLTGCRIDWEDRKAPYKFQVETSDDAKNWKVLIDHSKNEKCLDADYEFDTTARYVRVTCTGALPGHWVSIWELSVFGDEKVKVDPLAAKADADRARMADVKVPDGFEATLFAAPPAVSYPTFVAAAPDGVVYVSVDKNGSLDRQLKRGSVVRLRDIDGDGRADESKYYIPDVDSPRGLVWDHDRLYLMHPPHLSAFIDTNGDGIADEQKVLVKNIAFGFKDRPADHTSNGVTLGIDGWLYLAIGDFGFMQAEGTDGRKLQMRGGGVVRVRPDGTGLETYSNGTRNILEVAVDPLLNGFTRDNTNDGGGWDIRLHHFTGFEDHGYPRLYMNFGDEIIKPLADYGGGSGCGALFLDEPGFPKGFSPALYTADWGRSMVFRHQMTPHGATFTADQNEFLGLNRVTDLDVDGHSTLYATSWKGATFNYNGEDVGSLIRLRPKGLKTDPLPDFAKATSSELVAQLKSPSHRRRLEAQRSLLRRGIDAAAEAGIIAIAKNKDASQPSRVAAVFTLKQWYAPNPVPQRQDRTRPSLKNPPHEFAYKLPLVKEDADLAPFILRSATDDWWGGADGFLPATRVPVVVDGKRETQAVPMSARARIEYARAVGRFYRADEDAAQADHVFTLLLDEDPVVRHTARNVLVNLKQSKHVMSRFLGERRAGCLAGLSVLQSIHTPEVVDFLIEMLDADTKFLSPETKQLVSIDPEVRKGVLVALCRLHFIEGEWKGNSWGTRPDTRGPYFQPEAWAETEKIAAVLQRELDQADASGTQFLATQLARHRIELKDGLKSLLTKANSNPQFVPAVVATIYRSGNFPLNEALPLVSKVATAKETPAEQRSQAIVALLKTSNPEAFKAALAALELTRSVSEGVSTEALNTFKDLGTLNRHAKTLLALSSGDASDFWIDGGTLLLAEDSKKNKKNANKTEAESALTAAWSKPARRLPLLQAAEFFNTRTQEDLIRDGLSDSNKDVAAQAKKLADAWKISSTAPTGPKIGSLKPEEVLAAVMKMKGDAARGEGVYSKLNCNKCHTVKPDEPVRGPYLPNVAKTYKREQLIESILTPSKSIAQGFVTNVFVMSDGKQHSGFVINESAELITIRNNEGNELKLKVEDIEERAKQATLSMMPDNLAKDVTLEDFAALIAYLESLASRATK